MRYFTGPALAALAMMSVPEADARAYMVEMKGFIPPVWFDDLPGGSASALFAISNDSPFAGTVFRYQTPYGNFNLFNTSAGLNSSGFSGYAVSGDVPYTSHDYKYVSFSYTAHQYGTGEPAFDPNQPYVDLPFFSDTSAGVGTIIGSVYNGQHALINMQATSITVQALGDPLGEGGVLPTPLLGQKIYTDGMKEFAGGMRVAMQLASSAFSATGALADGPVGGAWSFMKDAAIASIVGNQQNDKLDEASRAVDVAKALNEIRVGTPLSFVLSIGSILADVGADRWERIRADPPDKNYKEAYIPDSKAITLDTLGMTNAEGRAWGAAISSLKDYADSLTGALHSAERFDAAQLAGDKQAQELQFINFSLYKTMAQNNALDLADRIDALSPFVGANISDWATAMADLKAGLATACASGFSADTASLLSGAGFNGTAADLAPCQKGYDLPSVDPKTALANLSSALRYHASTKSTTLSAVPEPQTWMLMVLGFGLIGFALRSRGNLRSSNPA